MPEINAHQEIILYDNMGDLRPPATTLHAVIDSVDPEKPRTFLRAADACIDMAMLDVPQADAWLDTAKSYCEQTIALADSQPKNSPRGYAETATTALVRETELSNWAAVAKNDSPVNNYGAALEAARRIAARGYHGPEKEAVALEFMPMLLGMRALAQGKQGWLGRLALTRENQRRSAYTEGVNWSWDTAIVTHGATSEEFDLVETKLQIKRSSQASKWWGSGNVRKYARGGIVTLSAKELGFIEPYRIIWGCVKEVHGEIPSYLYEERVTTPIDTDEIDTTTEKIRESIQDGQKLIQKVHKKSWQKHSGVS
jgi:hypothetical protein